MAFIVTLTLHRSERHLGAVESPINLAMLCSILWFVCYCLISEGTGITSLWVHAIQTALSATEPYLEAEFGVS